jgi:hypothetical protein
MLSRRDIVRAFCGVGASILYHRSAQSAILPRRRYYDRGRNECKLPRSFPSIASWMKILPGMSENDVLTILGSPFDRESSKTDLEPGHIFLYRWNYGELPIDAPNLQHQFRFDLYLFDGRVVEKHQPFDLADMTVLDDPKPSVPVIIYPEDGRIFKHHPRVIDCRWQPSVGDYPLSYIIEISKHQQSFVEENGLLRKDIIYRQINRTSVELPYYSTALPGKSGYSWRIKAVNHHGESEWTSPATFTFEV